ncbi:hypothetical protein NC651_017696 [Populus alba x Populus x berolinensis]|nr:hypothetical protein NC651_017696 [Populus alba x Populus x berolinensis]
MTHNLGELLQDGSTLGRFIIYIKHLINQRLKQAPVILAILSAGIQQPRELKILLDDYCNNQGFEMDLATDDFKVGGALRTLEWRKKTQTIIVFQSSPVMCKHEER